MHALRDPKTALLDLEHVEGSAPAWLATQTGDQLERCRDAAAGSRKRVPAVKPRPGYTGADRVKHTVAPLVTDRRDGDQPAVWDKIAGYFGG